ncbi:hypothetical protein FG386_003156 [Cryptosporidium ryanae]|uniref:uncharacterized protein n=1 Tax=Cryptosporidium ryanae TaxID=515981 RepID=UPI003519EF96|nr:hypothetical protein FG386_003156 [Cryptosporidium ryanae]
MLSASINHSNSVNATISEKDTTKCEIRNHPEQVTKQLINELGDPILFVRSCVLKGKKYISQCNKNLEIAINHLNKQLEEKLVELGQVKTIYNLCQEVDDLETNCKSVGEFISNYINSIEIKSIPIIQQYESIKESILISKRVIQIQDLCNRTIDFISLFNKLKVQFGLNKCFGYENRHEELFQKLQNLIPETVNMSKTSKMIVELENMVNFHHENQIGYKINSNEVHSLEFIEELQEEIKCLRKFSAIYRQHGHKKLVSGIENMDIPSTSSGCLILHQFNELWEHIDTFVDIRLKKLQQLFNVNVLQNCIEIENRPSEQFIVKAEFIKISILSVIERMLNHIIISFKQFVCLLDTITHEKLRTDQSTSETNFIVLFWEKSLKIIKGVFNIICTINIKQSLQTNNIDEMSIIGGSINLEQILHVIINSYPEISNMFDYFVNNINKIFSFSSSKKILTKIIDSNNIYDVTNKIKEKYVDKIKNKFNVMFDELLPSNKYIESKTCDINEGVSQIINHFFREIKIINNIELKKQICDLFKNKLLYFIVSCETIIQPEGGVINYTEYDNIKHFESSCSRNTELNFRILNPTPSNFHRINAQISYIAGLFSIELENVLHKESLNYWDEVEKDRIIELLKSLQYKSVGKWFSFTSLSIINICKSFGEKSISKNPTLDMSNESSQKVEDSFVLLSQKIVNNFVQEWIPVLNPIHIWYKCLIQLSRNISIIFLVNFILRVNLSEKNCFLIADEIVIFQSIISHLLLDQRIKNDINTDIKMVQDFRRILFSDIKSIREAIESLVNNGVKYSSNTEILATSIKETSPLLFSIHILNRIYFNLKSELKDLYSFFDFSRITYYQFYNTLASIMFKKLNCNQKFDSDSDLFIIFDIFTQNASDLHNDPKKVFSLIHNYVEYLRSEILKSDFNSDNLNIDDLILILDFCTKMDSDCSENEMDLNDQIVRQLRDIALDDELEDGEKLRHNVIDSGLVRDLSYDYVHGNVNLVLARDSKVKDYINNKLLELGWVNSVRVLVETKKETDLPFESSNILVNKNEDILFCLRKVIDPDLNKDIVSCNFVKDLSFDPSTSNVYFTLELTTPVCPMKDLFEKNCIKAIKENLEYINNVNINFTYKANINKSHSKEKIHKNLHKVSNIIAISSCKGGVGKSTIAVNIAFTLSLKGAKVGIVDCDIYGPNLEQLIPIENKTVFYRKSSESDSESIKINNSKRGICKNNNIDNNIETFEGFVPINYKNVKLISYSFLLNNKHDSNYNNKVSSIIRGPIAGSIVTQLITETIWEELDYLILDFPPGTGDIQLSIAQTISIDGSIIITTPQDLSISDVERGIHLFNKLNIPILTLVENMSYFICDGCNKKHEVFSRGDISSICEKYGLKNNFRFPLSKDLSKCIFYSDSLEKNFPFVIAVNETNDILLKFKTLCDYIVRKLSKYKFGSIKPKFNFDNLERIVYFQIPEDLNDIIINENPKKVFYHDFKVEYFELRKLCKCALCYNPVERKQKSIDIEFVPLEIERIDIMGSYAILIVWDDGHNTIISYDNLIKKYCEKKQVKLCQESLNW